MSSILWTICRQSNQVVYHLIVNSQLNEVNTIRRSLYDLEAQQSKLRQNYEEEIRRLRADIAASHQGPPSTSTAPPSGLSGITVRSLSRSTTPRLTADPLIRDRERGRERGRNLTPPDPEWSRETFGDKTKMRDNDRIADLRDPKRLKSEHIPPGMIPYTIPPESLAFMSPSSYRKKPIS